MGATLSLSTSNLFAFPVVLYCFYFNYFINFFGKMKTDLKNYYWSTGSTQTSNDFVPSSLSKCPYGHSTDIYNLADNALKKKMIPSYTQKNGLTPGQNGISYHNEKPIGTFKNGIRPNYCYIPEMQANMIKTQNIYNNYTRCPDRAESSNSRQRYQSRILERLIQNISETVRSLSWWKSGYFHENPYSFNSTFVNQNRCHRERLPYTYPVDSYNRAQKYMPTYDNPRCSPRRPSRDPNLFAKTHWFRESANDRTPKAHVAVSTTTLDPSPVENDPHSYLETKPPLTMSPVHSSEEKQTSQSPSIFTPHTKTSGQQQHHHHHPEEIMISDPAESPTNYDVVFCHPHGMLSGDSAVNTCQILEDDLPREVQNGLLEIDDDSYELVLTDCSVITYSFSEEREDDEFCKDELDIFSEDDDDDDDEESDSDYLDRCPSPLPPFKNHGSSLFKPDSNYSTDDDDDDSSDDLEVDGGCSWHFLEDVPVIKRPDSRCCLSVTDNSFLISPDDSDAISQNGDDDIDDWENTWSTTSPPVVFPDDEHHPCDVNMCASSFNPFFSASFFVSSSPPCGSPTLSSADSDVTLVYEEQLKKNLEKLKDVNERWNKAYNCDDDDDRDSTLQNEAENNNKKVTFATGKNLQTLHLLVCWPFAYQSARKGPWMELSLDSMRFHDRIKQMKSIIDPILDPAHRRKVFNLQAAEEST